MDYFSTFLMYMAYKLLGLAPLILILIAIIKLHLKAKNSGTGLMLVGNIGLITKLLLLDSLVDYFLRFTDTLSISNVSSVYTILGFIAIIFSFLFAIGFLMFVNSFVKKREY